MLTNKYSTPGVYLEDNPILSQDISNSPAVGGFIGVAQRGTLNVPILIDSWSAYIEQFALGMDSPFVASSDLAYSVYGFFQNGGKYCYVMRVAGENAKKATMKNPSEEPTVTLEALDEGVWGNNLKVTVSANETNESNFDVTITLKDEVVEKFMDLSNDTDSPRYWVDALTMSMYVRGVTGTLAVLEATAFTEGADGDAVKDETFTNAISGFDYNKNVSLICIPGQTSDTVNTALLKYCEDRKDMFAILDAPKASDISSLKVLRKVLNGTHGGLYFPFIKVVDPLSNTGKLRDCPTCGHVMGNFARTITEEGVWKAPAGTTSVIKGAVSVLKNLTIEDTDELTELGIIPIITQPNYGIIIWGARNLGDDSTMKYVSDTILDMDIKRNCYNIGLPFVFKPNDERTWKELSTQVETYLNDMWMKGALKGNKATEAYYVKCDADIMTDKVIEDGQIICEVGYASKKPAEYIIFRFSHTMAKTL